MEEKQGKVIRFPLACNGSIPLDKDIVHALLKGDTIYRMNVGKPRWEAGDKLLVKEPWRVIGGMIHYMVDEELYDGNLGGKWQYGRMMPDEYSKRRVVIDSVEKIRDTEFEKLGRNVVVYDGMHFTAKNSTLPYHRWFRRGKDPRQNAGRVVYVTSFHLVQF